MAQAADTDSATYVSFYHSPAKSITFSGDLLQRLMVSKEAAVCPQEDPMGKNEEIQGEMELNLGLSLGGYLVGKANEQASCLQKASSGDFQLCLRKLGSGNVDNDGKESRDSKQDGQADCGFAVPAMAQDDREMDSSGLMTEGSQQHVLPEIKQEGIPMTQIHHQPTAQQQQEMLEQQRKRELHALRRQEARKKREEKQLKKAGRERGMSIQASKVRNSSPVPLLPSYVPPTMRGSTFPSRIRKDSDKRLLETQMSSIRKKDRAAKENETASDRETKTKDRVLCQGPFKGTEDQNSRTSTDQTEPMVSNPNGTDPHPTSKEVPNPVLPVPYPPHVLPNNPQFMPCPVGLPFPYTMPFWTATKGCDAPKSNMPPFCNILQPVPSRALPSFQMPFSGASPGGFADPYTRSLQSSHASGASPVRSSSAVSEYESRTSQGASCNESKSQSSTSSALHRFSSVSNSQDQTLGSSEVSASSELEPQCAEEAPGKVPTSTAQSAPEIPSTSTLHKRQLTEASSVIKPSRHGSGSEGTIHNSDDPKTSEGDQMPRAQVTLPDMPCVSTTGEGPNGKTISGFLYSYSKDEVSIVCVCHGTFLSPAEFVQHAGGTDLSHPERHIVVNPFQSGILDASAMS